MRNLTRWTIPGVFSPSLMGAVASAQESAGASRSPDDDDDRRGRLAEEVIVYGTRGEGCLNVTNENHWLTGHIMGAKRTAYALVNTSLF